MKYRILNIKEVKKRYLKILNNYFFFMKKRNSMNKHLKGNSKDRSLLLIKIQFI